MPNKQKLLSAHNDRGKVMPLDSGNRLKIMAIVY